MSNNLLIGQLPLASSPAYIQSGDLIPIERADGETYQSYMYMSSDNVEDAVVQRDVNGNFKANIITAALAGTATYAQNISGGNVGSIPYQSGVGTTSMLAVNTGLLLGGTTPSYVTILPSIINCGNAKVTDPSTSSLNDLDTTLLNIYNHGGGGGSGTVTSVSVVTANGINGTVTNPTTNAAITLGTSISGIVKGNGTSFSAATAGVDYVIPSGSVANADNALYASSAAEVITNATSFNGTFYVNIVNSSVGGTMPVYVSSSMTYNPSTNVLAANFSGSLAGNASTATRAYNIDGGNAGSLIYQTAPHTTTTLPAGTGLLLGGTTPSYITTLPDILNADAVQVTNPSTSSLSNLSVALLDAYNHVGGGGSGTVTSVAFNNQNGFNFTVANPTTAASITPAISISGMLKGASGAITQALAGSDYVIPSGTVANATNAVTATNIAGGSAGALVYQTSANNTATLPVGSGLLFGGTTPSYITTLPSTINTGTTTVSNPITSSNSTLNIALQDIAIDIREVSAGGTGVNSLVNYAVMCGGTTVQQVSGTGTSGQILTSNGSGALPSWQNAPSGGSGLSPYNSSNTYNKGVSYITGDGTNGNEGFIYVCLVNGTTGTFNAANWAVESGLDLLNFNSYSAIYGLAASNYGQYNTYNGYNCGTAPSISNTSSFNNISGAFAFTSIYTITGQKNVIHGGSSSNGYVTSASYNAIFGFGAGTALTSGSYNLFLGYESGQNVDQGNGLILIGGASGSAGNAYNNKLIVANPQNNNEIIHIDATDTTFLPNQVLASPIDSVGALSNRALIPTYTTSQKTLLSGMPSGSLIFDSDLLKLCFYDGTNWQTITSA